MNKNLISHFLLNCCRCPDCGSRIERENSTFHCSSCPRQIFVKDNLIDLLPSKPLHLKNAFSHKAVEFYTKQFSIPASTVFSHPQAWNTEEEHLPSYRIFLDEEWKKITRYFPKQKQILCDFSGGAGYYSRKASALFRLVIHCDIDCEALQYAQNQAKLKNISNMIFVRTDYLRPSFLDNRFSACLSTDSLIYYGREYDLNTLKLWHGLLTPTGRIIFDLHYRRWYAPDKFIFEYEIKDLRYLKSHLPQLQFRPFCHLPSQLLSRQWVFDFAQYFSFLPPVRYVGVLGKKR